MNDRAAWLQSRKAGLGGSDIGAILGLSKYRTPVDVWADKSGRAIETDTSLQMRFGSYAEEFVAREYTAQTGRGVQRFNTMLHHPTAPILGNIDRLVIPEGQKRASHKTEIRTDRLLETKTASAFSASDSDEWGDAGTDLIPASYLVQVATYMMLTGCQYADLAVLFGNQEVRVYNITRDRELEQEIIARATIWWQRHVIADFPPEPTCEADIKWLYPKDSGKTIQANPKTIELIGRAQELKAQIAALESELDGDKKAGTLGVIGSLKAWMQDASYIELDGAILGSWNSSKDSQKTDWQALAIALGATPELIKQHTLVVPGARRFLIK